jgi:hypothetical protein
VQKKNIHHILLLVIFELFCSKLFAWHIELLNTIDDIAINQKISLRFCLDPVDHALYKDFLDFSIDSSRFRLASWKTSAAVFLEYAAPFRASKQVYMESFRVDLSFASDSNDVGERLAELQMAHLAVSCVILGKDKKNRAQSMVLRLDSSENNHKAQNQVKHEKASDGTPIPFTSHVGQKERFDEELFWVDQFLPLINKAINYLYSCLSMPIFLPWYFLILFLFSMIVMRRLFASCYFKTIGWQELERFLFFLFLAFHFNFLRFLSLKPYKILFGFAFFCLGVSVYYLKPLDQDKSSMLDALRFIGGILLLILVGSLFLKAFLLKFIV